MRKIRTLFAILMGLLVLQSCSINKGFEALEIYNYFEAKKQFQKSLKKNESPAAYGLSVIYFRNDNPFHNLDSAYHYGLLAVESYSDVKDKKQIKWSEKLNYTLDNAKTQRNSISDKAYNDVVVKNTVKDFQYFINNYPWSVHVNSAIAQRDSLAYLWTIDNSNSINWKKYLDKYPNSLWVVEAEENYYKAQYDETIEEGVIDSYLQFIATYPENPLIKDAQYQLYVQSTKENSIESYRRFIVNHPSSPYVNDAWVNLYRKSISNYTVDEIEAFKDNYPNFPLPELIESDLALVGEELYVFIKDDLIGFMNDLGEEVIPARYEYAGNFSNGLALVSKDDKYGYINKSGKLIIDYQFDDADDFNHGKAIVEIDDKYGLIDVSGKYVLSPVYDAIGMFSDGLAYVKNGEIYQYYTLEGKNSFSKIFDEAFTFDNGIARVRKGDTLGFINDEGDFIISTLGDRLEIFTDSIFVLESQNGWNLINIKGDTIFEEGFDRIGVLSDDRAIVERDGRFGYINSKGELVIPLSFSPYPNYIQFSQFKNNHSLIRKGQLYSMISDNGKVLLPAIFTGIGDYGPLIPVSKGDGWGYCNERVQLKIDYLFDYAYGFENDVAIVEKDDSVGVINLQGDFILPVSYQSIKRVDEKWLIVKKDDKYGVKLLNGNEVLALEYDRISTYADDILQLIKDNSVSYYNLTKEQMIRYNE